MTEPPDPLVPPDCDLRDFRFMPVEIERLRRSRAWLLAKRRPELGFYMFNLWIASWHEVPASSLEDDDDVLADAAVCEPRRWRAVRETVLRGWVKGPDGRLYHPVVAEKAREAWAERQAYRARTAAARAAKQHKQSGSVTTTDTETVTDDVTALKGQGQGQGQVRDRDSYTPPTPPSRGGNRKSKNGSGDSLMPEPPWKQRCDSWARGHRWNPADGPAPDEPGCIAPPDLIEEAIRKRALTGAASAA